MIVPLDLGERRYANADFLGTAYTASFPDFLRDAYSEINNYLMSGICQTSIPLLPSIKKVELQCSRNRLWAQGIVLMFVGRTTGQKFALMVQSYNKANGQLVGMITNVWGRSSRRDFYAQELRSDTYWYIIPPKLAAIDYNRTGAGSPAIASGGLANKLSTEMPQVRDQFALDRMGYYTLKLEDDFMQPGVYNFSSLSNSMTGGPFRVTSNAAPSWSSGVTGATWGVVRLEAATGGSGIMPDFETILPSAAWDRIKIDTNAATDFDFSVRVYLGTIPGGGSMRIRLGYTTNRVWNAADHCLYFEYNSTVSANWRYLWSNGTTLNTTTTALAVTFNTFHVLRMVKVGTTISVYINGALQGTINSGMPVSNVHPEIEFVRPSGSGTSFCLVDYIRCRHACNF